MEPTHDEHEEFIFRSKLPDIYIPTHLPLHTYLFENLSQFKDRPCLIDGNTGETFTYADVELTARKVAAGLNNIGIKQYDVILVLLHNCPQFVFAFLGASYRGAIVTPGNPLYTSAEVAKQAIASNAKLIITQSSCVEKVKDFARENGIKVMCIDTPPEGDYLSFSELITSNESDIPTIEISQDDVFALPYSSGTTGKPKGVMLTHKGLVTTVAQQVDGENPNVYLHSKDVILCVLPLYHIFAINSALLCGLRVGAAILIMPRFEIIKVLQLVQKHKVTFAPFVPPIILAIAKNPEVERYDLSSIRMIMSGAAPLGKELVEAFSAKLPNVTLGQGYGMTEAGPVLSMSLAFAKEPFEAKSGSCGTVIRNAEMKIIDPDTGTSLPRNKAGEICIRGNQIMKGYLNNPDATKISIDEGGWLHSGDIGYIADNGELFVVDRLKEIIKYKGYQVAPAELEDMLISHPDIFDTAVVSMKDEDGEEVPVAYVVRSNGSEILEDEIKQYISKQVVFYKRIKRVFFVDSIPKASSGKILRKELRARLAAGPIA
ncbi:hypothetical protein TanjilG_09453 [Lupinus angustifolius]|uniref:4-coumarate--CoA ligase n=1 Tax=Lupinus angustifolius TaxID=3871 RepID=A0A4P1RX22_LUPAN|nr:PREDICTED: 4-coumarate--CoA ligase 1-like [Lupinus angustifolius]OIW19433.1 hypothetical protein TanjilG_09453 [Lupinus angustifolius]